MDSASTALSNAFFPFHITPARTGFNYCWWASYVSVTSILIPHDHSSSVCGDSTLLTLYILELTRPSRTSLSFQQALQWQSVSDEDFVAFGNVLFTSLRKSSPLIPKLNRSADAEFLVFWRAQNDTNRPDLLSLSESQIDDMRQAHNEYLKAMKHIDLPYQASTRGIVSTAGEAQLPLFVLSLRMLRRTGCTLPVELFLQYKEERNPFLCDTLLPSLGARCVCLEDFLKSDASTLAKFQLKVFSIIFSSFEDLLFLDADNYLVHNPEHLFAGVPFTSFGLVTWPDFWASSASKHLYSIQNKPVPLMNARASSESGQLLVSRRSHSQALLMSAYYNFYGPNHYYHLLSQGGPGEGDKESFVAGAEAVSARYYQVQKCVDTIGYYEDGRYHGVAMVQYDPTPDTKVAKAQNFGQVIEPEQPRPLTVHHNYPKPDPVELLGLEGAAINQATGAFHRLLGSKELTEQRFGRDFEREIWEEMRYIACDIGDKFQHWDVIPSTNDRRGTCEMVNDYIATIF